MTTSRSTEESFQPDWVVHPGDIVKDAMEERGWTVPYTALRLGWSVDDLQALLDGKVSVRQATASLLGTVFGTSPQFWTNLQYHYDQDSKRLGLKTPS